MKLIILIVPLLLTHAAICCTCMTIQTEIDSQLVMNRNYEIFVGKVVTSSVRYEDNTSLYTHKVLVKKQYTLNSTAKYITLRTPTMSSACGFNFDLGQTYLITVRTNPEKEGIRYTSLCLRNVNVKEATEEIELIENVIKNSL